MPSAETLLREIRALPLGDVRIMEVCGTHTMAIAEAGIRSLLPENVKLLSGPGCPVCVIPAERSLTRCSPSRWTKTSSSPATAT